MINMDWLAVGAVGLSVITMLMKILDKSLSIREHDEYRKGVEREIDKIEARIGIIEATRPTSGMIETSLANLKERLDELKKSTRTT